MGAQLDALLVKLASGGTPWKRSVDVATTAPVALSGLSTIDGVTVQAGERVLVQDQADAAQNGIYVAAAGAWSRASDMDRDSFAQLGTAVRVMRGTANGAKVFYISSPTSGDIRVGTTAQTWAAWSVSGGGSGTVTPDPDELVLRDGSGRAFATEFVGPAAADVVVEAQAGYSCSFNAPTANYKFSDTTTSAYPVTLVCDGTQSFITCSSTSGFRYRAAEHTFSNTTASAITGSLTVELRSGEMRIEGKGASKPVELHAPSGQELRLASLGGSRMRLGASGTIALDRWDGAAWEEEGSIQAVSDGVIFGGTDPSSTSIKLTNANAVEVSSDSTVATTVGSTLTLTESDSSGTYLLAANAPMRVQPETPGAGAGRTMTVAGGDGAASSAGGNVDLRVGAPGAGSTTHGTVRLVSGTGNEFGRFERYAGGDNTQLTTGTLATGATIVHLGSTAVMCATTGGSFENRATTVQRSIPGGSTPAYRDFAASAAIASATTTSIVTFATTADRVYQCVGYLTVSNDTDNEGAAYMVRAAFKRVAGTVTQIGSTQAIAADLEDAAQTGLSAVLDFSGTDIRLRLTTDSGDTVNVNGVLVIYERVLA